MPEFDDKSCERIATATTFVEKMMKNQVPGLGKAPVFQESWFFAEITDTDGEYGWYSWRQLEPLDYGDLQGTDNWRTGDWQADTGYAVEMGGSPYVLNHSWVIMFPAKSQPYYVFRYAPGIVNGKTTTTISKRSGNTMGQGRVMVKLFQNGTLIDAQEIKVFNPYQSEIKSGKIVQIGFGNGIWSLVGEDCTDEESGSGY